LFHANTFSEFEKCLILQLACPFHAYLGELNQRPLPFSGCPETAGDAMTRDHAADAIAAAMAEAVGAAQRLLGRM
jgi:hypothetical protein